MSSPATDRRAFLTGMVAAPSALAALADPTRINGHGGPSTGSALPEPTDPRDEAYWTLVKAQFPLRPGLVLLNAANLCPSPRVVQDAVFEWTRDIDADPSFQNRAKLSALREEARAALAAHVGADPHEIAVTRNTSESNNTVVNGLDLGPGDEVVLWSQNHPTNSIAWDVRSERDGFSVVRVETPPAPASDDDLARPFERALSGRTRVLAFSHVSNATGVRLPAARLCARARQAGVRTLVDGAQTFGALELDLHAIGCDYFTGSAHKWFVGPKEAGLLYVRSDRIDELWASDVGVGWQGAVEDGARKFENLGQRDDAAVLAMATTAEFHAAIGPRLIEARLHVLRSELRSRVLAALPSAEFLTPEADEQAAGVLVFSAPGLDRRAVYQRLYDEHGVAAAAMPGGVRFSTHLYVTMADVDRVGEALAEVVG